MDSPYSPGNNNRSSSGSAPAPSSLMDNLLGLLRIRVKRGVNLAVRDVRSSDPYVVIKMGKQVQIVNSSFPPFHLAAEKTKGKVAEKLVFSNSMFN